MPAKEPYRIKSYKLYAAGKMIGTLETADYTIQGNDEQHITAEGVSYSDGTPTTEINGNTVVPVDGRTDRIVSMILNKEYVQVQAGVVDGKIHVITMRCMEAKYNTDMKSGSLKGSFKFSGGAPERT